MSDIKSLLLWEKYRPKNMDDLIILPRIRKIFQNGVTNNYIFHGHFGTGKTSLARILIGRYTKDTPFLELNCSIDTSIDLLRNEIEDFCKFVPMMETKSDLKYVFLDESERTSQQFQDGFKAFAEKYSSNVRFILSTNHINKVSDGIKSRISSIDFNCQSLEEEKYLKTEIFKKINNIILPKEGKEIPKSDLISIITKNFPDFRSTLIDVQVYLETGSLNNGSSNVSTKTKLELYNCLYDTSMDSESIYHFLMDNFGAEKIDVVFGLLGRPFIDWSLKEKRDNIDKLFKCAYIISDYYSKLETNTDPIILGLTVIGKFRDILN